MAESVQKTAVVRFRELVTKWRNRSDTVRAYNTGGYTELMSCIEEVEFTLDLLEPTVRPACPPENDA
jgi:hypothetical protein